MDAKIGSDVLPLFIKHLDALQDPQRISLYLYTRGGDTLAAWSIINLIRNFCKELEIIVPFNCHSAGTLMCLGANNIVMTKQATLGPIDPSVTGPLNPKFNDTLVPVSVETINAFLEMATKEMKIKDQQSLAQILISLSEKVHPLSLGQVYRSKSQIKMLAEKLLSYQDLPKKVKNRIVSFLCKDSGSHDYTIHRREAKELGLAVETPDMSLYKIIWDIYCDIEKELELSTPYNPAIGDAFIQGNNVQYDLKRAIIETASGGSHSFVTRGTLVKNFIVAQNAINIADTRTKDGWIYEP